MHWSEEENVFLKQNYIHGSRFCSKFLKRTIYDTRQRIRKLDLKLTHEERCKLRQLVVEKSPEQFKVNINNFLHIRTAEAAYILGLIWADGHINLSTTHKDVMLSATFPDAEDYIKIFKKNGEWRVNIKQNRQHPTWKTTVIISTSNRPLANYLKTKNYCSKHESATPIIESVPTNLKHYWFRGLMDGDGSIYIKNSRNDVTITGPLEQNWDFMLKLCKELDISFQTCKRHSIKGNCSRFRIRNRGGVFKFLDYIYQGATYDGIYLYRKYYKYQSLIKTYRGNTLMQK